MFGVKSDECVTASWALQSFFAYGLLDHSVLKAKITLKTKDNTWIKPGKIIFGKDFTDGSVTLICQKVTIHILQSNLLICSNTIDTPKL
jgi:hypothetical protein